MNKLQQKLPSNPSTNPLTKQSASENIDQPKNASEMDNVLSMMEKLLHWAAIIESSDDAIISKSLEGKITSWNRGAQRLYGYTPEEVIGKPVSMLMPPERENDFPNIMNELLEGRKVEHYETKRKTKDGRVIDVSLTVSPIRDSTGRIIGASKIARDITDRVEYERRREDFISTASHELKTPITSQKVYGELLEKIIEKNGHEEYLPYIQKINNQTRKLEKLIVDLLELSRLHAGRLKLDIHQFEIDDLLNEVIQDLSYTYQHQIIHETRTTVMVQGDRDRIGQVFTNLLTNAIKYSPRADKVIVTTEPQENFVVVSIQDFGIGIDPQFHHKIFERFFRVSGADEKTYPGMGIGLEFSREVIDRHGGKVWVSSQKGEGATFFVSLPIDPQDKPGSTA